MLNIGKQSAQFFDSIDVWNPHTGQNEKKWKLKSLEQYSRDHGTNEQPGKQVSFIQILLNLSTLTFYHAISTSKPPLSPKS